MTATATATATVAVPTPKNRVQRHQNPANALMFNYILPTDTLDGRTIACHSKGDARGISIWAQGLMAHDAVAELIFRTTRHAIGQRDTVQVTFRDTESRDKYQPSFESVLSRFASNVTPDGKIINPKLALINLELSFTNEQFTAYADGIIAKEKNTPPYIAGIRALVEVFNECIVRPDGGEVVYQDYTYEQGKGTAYVNLTERCKACGSGNFTMDRLEKFIVSRLPGAVSAVKRTPAPV